MPEFDDLDQLREVVQQGEWKEVIDRQEELLALIAELRASREVVRAARDFLPQESTSGGIGPEDWNDLRLTIAGLDAVFKAGSGTDATTHKGKST